MKEWESSSKKIEEDDDEEDFKETDVVLLKSEQKDIINKISTFSKKQITDFIEDFKVYKGIKVIEGQLNIDFGNLSPGQQ